MWVFRYRFDPKIQAVYGTFGSLVSPAVPKTVSGGISVITALIIGNGNLLIAGFSTSTIMPPDGGGCGLAIASAPRVLQKRSKLLSHP